MSEKEQDHDHDHASASVEAEKSNVTVSLPQSLILAVVASVLGVGGFSGLSSLSEEARPERESVQMEVVSLRKDINRLGEKIDDIYDIVDRAHPRVGSTGGKP